MTEKYRLQFRFLNGFIPPEMVVDVSEMGNAFKASEKVPEFPTMPFTTDAMTSNKRTPLFKAKRYGSNPEKLLVALENLDSLKLTDESDQHGEE